MCARSALQARARFLRSGMTHSKWRDGRSCLGAYLIHFNGSVCSFAHHSMTHATSSIFQRDVTINATASLLWLSSHHLLALQNTFKNSSGQLWKLENWRREAILAEHIDCKLKQHLQRSKINIFYLFILINNILSCCFNLQKQKKKKKNWAKHDNDKCLNVSWINWCFVWLKSQTNVQFFFFFF